MTTVEVTHLIGDTTRVDAITVKRRERVSTQLWDTGRAIVIITRDNTLVRSYQYLHAVRIVRS